MSSSFQYGDRFEMRILIADANHQNRSIRARSLDLLGYRVDEASSVQKTRAKLDIERYDLLLLNLDTGLESGQELMSVAREIQPWLLLIVMTENPTLDSAINAIKAGVSDYLLEPVNIQDIFRSVASALQNQAAEKWNVLNYVSQLMDDSKSTFAANSRSPVEQDRSVITIGTLTLDMTSQRLAVEGDASFDVKLTKGGATVMAGLMANPNRVLSCKRIAKICWEYDVPEDQARSIVRPAIYRLRRRIETDPGNPEIIRTIRGRGYIFTPG